MPVLQTNSKRINSIDILRGIVMIVMALDHTRDYFSDFKFDPTDLQHASTEMFLTRWITHFCAPVFIFLSGTSAYLSMRRNGSKSGASRRLFTRGLWLIVLEVTFVRLGWAFDFNYSLVFLQVIWAIGCSMLALSALIFLPRELILGIGLIMIFGHNALDNFHPANMTTMWQLLHVQSPIIYGNGNTIMVLYPLIPWIGVMATGYSFGRIFKLPERQRHKVLYNIGFSAIILFLLLRATNFYGDMAHWRHQETMGRTVLSFINCTKYPPSLLYLLMTLGPAITLLPVLEKMKGMAADIFSVYGRVPLFYYVIHIYLIHSMAVVCSYFFRNNAAITVFLHPGYSLPMVYFFWALAIAMLYLPCKWFMGVKQTHKQWWLSYL
jgi:uncharacterized membrane protein